LLSAGSFFGAAAGALSVLACASLAFGCAYATGGATAPTTNANAMMSARRRVRVLPWVGVSFDHLIRP
jgi:hypothetical protein